MHKVNTRSPAAVTYKDTVATTGDLPLTGNALGDMYIVKQDGHMYIWKSNNSSGTIKDWVDSGPGVDMSKYRTAVDQDVIDSGKQAKITASGILKGDGSGNVSAAVSGTDYDTASNVYQYSVDSTDPNLQPVSGQTNTYVMNISDADWDAIWAAKNAGKIVVIRVKKLYDQINGDDGLVVPMVFGDSTTNPYGSGFGYYMEEPGGLSENRLVVVTIQKTSVAKLYLQYFTVDGGSGSGNADFDITPEHNIVATSANGEHLIFDFTETDTLEIRASIPGSYEKQRILATKDYVNSKYGGTIDVVPSDDKFTVNDPDGINSVSLQVGGAGVLFDISGSQVAELASKTYIDSVASSTFVIDTANPCSYNELQNAINTPKVILIKHEGVVYPFVEKWESEENTKRYVNIAALQRQTVNKGAMYFFFEAAIGDFDSPMAYSSNFEQPTGKPYTDSIVGNLAELTTIDKTNLVKAINEVSANVGEPFRVKSWAGTFNVSIEPCTTDKSNTQLSKTTFSINDVEGADYRIVGMISYEIFDSDGNRLNVWPVCQFTGNGQKELSVRWVCAGTTAKTAKRINAWVLLKHR